MVIKKNTRLPTVRQKAVIYGMIEEYTKNLQRDTRNPIGKTHSIRDNNIPKLKNPPD
jgi:hypothetical protein